MSVLYTTNGTTSGKTTAVLTTATTTGTTATPLVYGYTNTTNGLVESIVNEIKRDSKLKRALIEALFAKEQG
jgi:hypothetical protein